MFFARTMTTHTPNQFERNKEKSGQRTSEPMDVLEIITLGMVAVRWTSSTGKLGTKASRRSRLAWPDKVPTPPSCHPLENRKS